MKFRNYKTILLLALLGVFTSCTDGFEDINKDPSAVAEVSPQEFFGSGVHKTFNSSRTHYYEYYRGMLPWTQLHASRSGNSFDVFRTAGNMENFYNNFYDQSGPRFVEVMQKIDNMSDADKASYQHVYAYSQIMMVYNSWMAADARGSLAYNDAFGARYGGSMQPEYDNQQTLFSTWDSQLKDAVAKLSNTSTEQVNMADWDFMYHGDSVKWIKAANALRIKLAMRLQKRDAAGMQSIINEVLNSGNPLPESIEDGFVFVAGNQFSEHSDFAYTSFSPTKAVTDFMNQTEDPRRRLLMTQNDYSSANIAAAVAEGLLPAGSTDSTRYVGVFADPDTFEDHTEYSTANNRELADGTILDTVSYYHTRLWYPEYTGDGLSGGGKNTFPILTFADYCFMRAELALDGIGGTDVETWYNRGIEASIKRYNQMASDAEVPDVETVSDEEIAAYLDMPLVKYDASIAREQIATQAYLHYYKQPNEAWALVKRTGMPNNSTILSLEEIINSGNVVKMPRRFPLSTPNEASLNYENEVKALEEMQSNPGFGTLADITGRVWWDQQ